MDLGWVWGPVRGVVGWSVCGCGCGEVREEALAPHRSLLCAIAWRLFLLLGAGDADVRSGAEQRWASLLSLPWLRWEAFGPSPLGAEFESLQAGEWQADGRRLAAFRIWLAEQHAEVHGLLRTTLGLRWREEQRRRGADKAAYHAQFEQAEIV